MRKKIYSAFSPSDDLREYFGQVSFAGYIGSENEYSAFASNEEEAREDILEQAEDELAVEDINQIADDEWEVTFSYAGFIGIEETYTVYADSESEAEAEAMEEASWDLELVDLYQED